MEIFETRLPGVGVRYEFETARRERVGVVVRRDGVRELALYHQNDPDKIRATLTVDSSEAAVLVELLGGTKVTERLADLRQEVEGLAMAWVTLLEGKGLTGRTIGEGHIRTETGASVVAVIRGSDSFPGPGPEFGLEAGDVVLVMGAAPSVDKAVSLLAG